MNFPEFSGISLERGFWDPRIPFLGEDEVDMLGSGDAQRMDYIY